MTKAPHLNDFAQIATDVSAIMQNNYLILLENGEMSLEAFKISQEQFYHAVNFFPRPMAALIARIPSARARMDILHNLVEEHGEFNEQAFHCTTFKRFLASLEGSEDCQPTPLISPAVHAFNNVLMGTCALDELETAIACMGMIEFTFAQISARIAEAVVQRGWVQANKLVHYKLHAKIDERHADDFFAVIEESFCTERRLPIEQGIKLGLHIFHRLYDELATMAQPSMAEEPLSLSKRDPLKSN